MPLLFVRHGESEADRLGIISNRGRQHGLTDVGRQQAADLAQRLAGAGVSGVYSSPLLRAAQTAEIIAGACGLAVVEKDSLREFDLGVWEGRSDPTAWAAHRRLMEAWIVDGNADARADGGESLAEARARFVPFIERLTSEDGAAAPGSAAVLVGHAGLFAVLLPLVLTNLRLGFHGPRLLPYASPVVAEVRPGGLVCLEWAGTPIPL